MSGDQDDPAERDASIAGAAAGTAAGTASEGEGWLTRLSADEWMRAATAELARANDALVHKHQRAGVTQARRAAGMAWNAVLLQLIDPEHRARYGRSYMDHLKTLSTDDVVPAAVREAAAILVKAPTESTLVQLGAGDTRLATAAALVVEEAYRRVRGEARS